MQNLFLTLLIERLLFLPSLFSAFHFSAILFGVVRLIIETYFLIVEEEVFLDFPFLLVEALLMLSSPGWVIVMLQMHQT